MNKLTIGIPIYNGANTISETLNSVLKNIPLNVEVLVSDNASTDDTRNIIESYCKKYTQITYYRNDVNLGADANFDLVVKRAAGEFVWLLGDDDEIHPNGIELILNAINSYPKISALFVNYCLYDRKSGVCLNPKVLKIDADVFCETADQFLNVATVYPNFISSIVVKKSRWGECSSSNLFGTNWLQYGMLLKIIEFNQSICIANPIVINRGVEFNGPNEFNRNGAAIPILMNLIDILNALPRNVYSLSAINKAKGEAHRFLLRKIFSSKRDGLKINFQLMMGMISTFRCYPTFWLLELPLMLMPRAFHYLAWRAYKFKNISWLNRLIGRFWN
ncbi:hypothetical protein C5F52_17495 [Limnohabitans sp. TS-CS-82]|uniref:glycosyltransferase family 2 protein n=1 Tax=Limnohabitans sp. TS-CS-82 TaxID=2094193 RepID=UPI000CF2EAA1|nr:glycosyltransferase family 2 protein [Limnohabitans sp. TS-CS-82]PQA81815.1 hypothetical protein C5F52_17495 [Limnohabitans sp. TS-CS-82]